MRKQRVVAAIGGFVLATGLSIAPAAAAPGDEGNGVGGCIDFVYGNATNERPSGNGVLPSQSPGPFVNMGENEPPRDDFLRGASIGDLHQLAQDLGQNGQDLVEACRA